MSWKNRAVTLCSNTDPSEGKRQGDTLQKSVITHKRCRSRLYYPADNHGIVRRIPPLACYFPPTDCSRVHQFCCLVTLSSGLQYITKHKLKDGGDFITGVCDDPLSMTIVVLTPCMKAFNAANEVLRLMLDRLLPSGYLPYCPEQVFVFTAFAAASLMKVGISSPYFSGP